MNSNKWYQATDNSTEKLANGNNLFYKGDIIEIDWNAYDSSTAKNHTQNTFVSPACNMTDMKLIEEMAWADAWKIQSERNKKFESYMNI